MRMKIRQLTPADTTLYIEHRRQALQTEPLAFLSSPQDDLTVDADAFRERLGRAPLSVIFGAFEDELVGSVGIYREPKLKAAHKAHIWGMYVAPKYRRRGIGRGLLLEAVQHARSLPDVIQVQLGVSEVAVGARKLYESMGFRPWGEEPRYLQHEGRYVSCQYLVLRLDA